MLTLILPLQRGGIYKRTIVKTLILISWPYIFSLGLPTLSLQKKPVSLSTNIPPFKCLSKPSLRKLGGGFSIDEASKQDGVRIQDHCMDNSQHVYQEAALQDCRLCNPLVTHGN